MLVLNESITLWVILRTPVVHHLFLEAEAHYQEVDAIHE